MDPKTDNLVEFCLPYQQGHESRPNTGGEQLGTPFMQHNGQFASIRQIVHEYNNLFTILQGNLRLVVDTDDKLSQDTLEIIEDALSAAVDGTLLTQALKELAETQG